MDQGVSEPTKPIAFDTLEAALAALAEREAARLKYGRFLAADPTRLASQSKHGFDRRRREGSAVGVTVAALK